MFYRCSLDVLLQNVYKDSIMSNVPLVLGCFAFSSLFSLLGRLADFFLGKY